jgi:hypothetical protein
MLSYAMIEWPSSQGLCSNVEVSLFISTNVFATSSYDVVVAKSAEEPRQAIVSSSDTNAQRSRIKVCLLQYYC